ncbi:MAG: ABC transporter ATP-binding protein [Candidatus Promineifilaceae bacterium]
MSALMRGLHAEAYDRQYSDGELMQRIGTYFSKHRRRATIVIASVVLLSILNAMPPIIISRGIGLLEDSGNTAQIPFLIAAIFTVGVLNWLANWVQRYQSVHVIENVVLDMRTDAFNAAARQDMAFFDEYSSGRIVSRITSDTEEFGRILQLIVNLIQQVATAVLLLSLLISIDLSLTLILFGLMPLVLGASFSFRHLARRVTRQSSRVLGEVNRSIQEAVTGIGVAKNFRQEQKIYDEFTEVNAGAYDINLRRALVIALIFPTLAIMLGLATSLLVYFGGRAVLADVIILSAWYLFVATVDRFWFPLLNMSAFWSQFQQGLAACERVFALVDAETRVAQNAQTDAPELNGHIAFHGVDFRYSEREQILKGFDLTIKPGETLAIVGHTGAGKSSIIRIVTRFYEFQGGKVLIDGQDIRSFELTSYRDQLGIVSQIPFLFEGTVADNIRFGRPNATDQDIQDVANQVGKGEWLETLPEGLKTLCGERGSRLSMGQRQLVALARVLLANPSIFILDEATANIDPFTEQQVQEALQLVMQNRTSIVIAHRLSTIKSADRILVLDKGRIKEQGSHNELIALNGDYAELYNAYFRHQSLDYIEQKGWEGEK